uniref:Uncharacterized protein n=1 Tax=Anguilla anguilla TaxID=7936 RepID=A0A0E9QQL1_ANGAN
MAGINEDYRSPVPCWKEVAWQHHGVNVQDFLNTVFFVCGEALLWLQQVQEQVPFTPRTSAWPPSSF